jgi:hypothetical protein
MYSLPHGRILGGERRGDRPPPPESVFKELIICEIHISNIFNLDHFITKSNCAWL